MVEFGGVTEDLGGVAKKLPPPPGPPPPEGPGESPNGGGEAGDGGPPLDVPGGLIRFSFCRLEPGQA